MTLELYFPIECLEDIFRHLDYRDLLECTLVCPDWNNFIGSTTSCMKKIKLECPSYDLAELKRKQIFTSKYRKYEYLELSQHHHFKQLRKVLLPVVGTLTHVTLDMHFQTSFSGLFDDLPVYG